MGQVAMHRMPAHTSGRKKRWVTKAASAMMVMEKMVLMKSLDMLGHLKGSQAGCRRMVQRFQGRHMPGSRTTFHTSGMSTGWPLRRAGM